MMGLDMNEEPPKDDAAPLPEREITCQSCHRPFREQLIVVFSGRQLCFGCAGAWFDEDEDEDA